MFHMIACFLNTLYCHYHSPLYTEKIQKVIKISNLLITDNIYMS